MGRKQKLRKEKKKNPKNSTPLAATCLSERDLEFPKSHFLVLKNFGVKKLRRGAVENGCVHSMFMIGELYLEKKQIHLAFPWFFEGALRGNWKCTHKVTRAYLKVKPFPMALTTYWAKMFSQLHNSTFNSLDSNVAKLLQKSTTIVVERNCVICNKEDTKTLTLRQCMGCSMCCYCSEDCQIKHWVEHNHRSECKQVKILNKYHKPYANDIREAAIRGETHPRLEKLRSKLGLSRPLEEYEELCQHNMHEGKSINPIEFLIAREDGTVWIGSNPNPIGPPSFDTDSTTTTTKKCAATNKN